ncbi:RNA 2',3'-cyclic phosphodiesterase [Shewanella sp. GutDb-MelDb]|uniref:RNA 2',3'-cyclic phosphodiesterase n=1 Tax=Shewanella sp. GutDb-MelDb TaxID=2058316 RepID=UPI000C7B984E|nr:RNA 2',3'-cyclic phosphodiesterase [Shewanella sp. GutDb-MelDb]PKG56013.1 RNA 2',3'-cyclic phosphodiesterase [Shewanella sp. GutDb-MelDb]
MADKRVFLGFSLTPKQAQYIEAIQQQLPISIRLVPRDNLHMTLAFLGQASNKTIDALILRVDALNKPCFKVTLDLIEHWQKPKILCLKGTASDPNLMALAKTAQLIAQQHGLHQSEHHYNPHITLARKAKVMVNDVTFQPILLQPTVLHLFESFAGTNGVEYPILHSWSLSDINSIK